MPDVVLIGAGVIGLSIAEELAAHGQSVLVLDQGTPGKESSWAGAGMLPPGNLAAARTPEAKLRGLSARMWEATSRRLKQETGIDNGYLPCGSLCIGREQDRARLDEEIGNYEAEGIELERLNAEGIRKYESQVSPNYSYGYRLPGAGQVRNPRHLSAMLCSATAKGVEIRGGLPCLGFESRGERVTGVRTPQGTIGGGTFIVTGGAWSSELMREGGCTIAVRPVRGQIVLLRTVPRILNHLVEVGIKYLVPRADERVLLGATQEEVGFDKSNTLEGIEELLSFGRGLVPELNRATIERTWAGLRPGSADGLPVMGRLPRFENAYVAAGHFRSGLQMSLGTAQLMRQLILGEEPEIEMAPYSADAEVRKACRDTLNERDPAQEPDTAKERVRT